jgi:hypothetical protein
MEIVVQSGGLSVGCRISCDRSTPTNFQNLDNDEYFHGLSLSMPTIAIDH